MKRDIVSLKEVCNWLEINAEKKRDRDRRTGSKRMVARLIAAQQLLKAASGDTQATESVMNRTEGKVAEKHIHELDGSRLIDQLEAARKRVLEGRLISSQSQEVIEGEVLTGSVLGCVPSVDEASGTPGDSAGSHQAGRESHSTHPNIGDEKS